MSQQTHRCLSADSAGDGQAHQPLPPYLPSYLPPCGSALHLPGLDGEEEDGDEEGDGDGDTEREPDSELVSTEETEPQHYSASGGMGSGRGKKYLAAPPPSHYNSAQSDGPPPIDQAIFKKYIKYSRAFVKPVLREVDSEKVGCVFRRGIALHRYNHNCNCNIYLHLYVYLFVWQIASLYADLRTQSMVSGGVPIAVRHIER